MWLPVFSFFFRVPAAPEILTRSLHVALAIWSAAVGGAASTTWPMLLPVSSVNQRLPSGPLVIPKGELLAVGMGNSSTPVISSFILPTFPLSKLLSLNQTLPSRPVLISWRHAV